MLLDQTRTSVHGYSAKEYSTGMRNIFDILCVHCQKHVNIGVENVYCTKNNEKLTKRKRLESSKKDGKGR